MKKKSKYTAFTVEIKNGKRIVKMATVTKEDERRIKKQLAKTKWKKVDL